MTPVWEVARRRGAAGFGGWFDSLPGHGWRGERGRGGGAPEWEVARRRVAAVFERWFDSLPGHGWRRAHELDLVTQTLALAAQQVLCTAPLLVATSAIVRRASGRGMGG